MLELNIFEMYAYIAIAMFSPFLQRGTVFVTSLLS